MNYNAERNNKVLLLGKLRRIRVDKTLRTHGICHGIDVQGVADLAAIREVDRLFVKWPEFSGDIFYPIQGMIITDSYAAYKNSIFRWSKILPYGRARWRLLNFMIDTLEAELGYK